MFKDSFNICCFIVWTCQVLINLYVIYYHATKPHHPKFYSTLANRIAIICHIIGGAISTIGFYLGALLNMKVVCIVAATAGIVLHLPTVVWNNRHTHGQREMSAPSYFMVSVLLLKSYVHFFLYDANYQTVFSCGMTLNIYALVRVYYFISGTRFANTERQYDRLLIFAGLSNAPFSQGIFTPLYICLLYTSDAADE